MAYHCIFNLITNVFYFYLMLFKRSVILVCEKTHKANGMCGKGIRIDTFLYTFDKLIQGIGWILLTERGGSTLINASDSCVNLYR